MIAFCEKCQADVELMFVEMSSVVGVETSTWVHVPCGSRFTIDNGPEACRERAEAEILRRSKVMSDSYPYL